jgi:NAD(P)-dependent dehydrogenase (short-subunit alcohol dehydrogenase family)
VEFLSCNLSDMTVVKRVPDELVDKLERLDILVNNAGRWPLHIRSSKTSMLLSEV